MRKVAVLLQFAGGLLFSIAFLLPAVTLDKNSYGKIGPIDWPSHVFSGADSELSIPEAIPGWQCAKIALTLPFDNHKQDGWFLVALVFVSGLLNIAILGYILSILIPGLWVARRFAAVTVLFCLFDTWVFFASVKYYPLIGHYLWTLGAILIVSPEIVRLRIRNAQ